MNDVASREASNNHLEIMHHPEGFDFVLWSTAAAALFVLTLTGCVDNALVQTEDRPQTVTEIPAESTAPVESEIILFSAGDKLPVENSMASGEPTASLEPVTPAPAKPAIKFDVTTQERDEESYWPSPTSWRYHESAAGR